MLQTSAFDINKKICEVDNSVKIFSFLSLILKSCDKFFNKIYWGLLETYKSLMVSSLLEAERLKILSVAWNDNID